MLPSHNPNLLYKSICIVTVVNAAAEKVDTGR